MSASQGLAVPQKLRYCVILIKGGNNASGAHRRGRIGKLRPMQYATSNRTSLDSIESLEHSTTKAVASSRAKRILGRHSSPTRKPKASRNVPYPCLSTHVRNYGDVFRLGCRSQPLGGDLG